MKKMIVLSSVTVLALMFSGCSELSRPTGPQQISPVSFPQDADPLALSANQPSAPIMLEVSQSGSGISLCWQHDASSSIWFRVYASRDGRDLELIRLTQDLEISEYVGNDWRQISYRVTAVNSQGSESPFSVPALVVNSEVKESGLSSTD